MKNRFTLLIFLLLLPDFLIPQDFTCLPNCTIVRSSEFNGEGLWGHINGGADLYLEYGFTKLRFYELRVENFTFRLEDYEMTDEDAAFGIYSLSKFKCFETSDLPADNCISQYQTQLLLSNHYISIVNSTGTEKEREINLSLAKLMTENRDSSFFKIPVFFKHNLFAKYSQDIKLFNGILGIQNGAPHFADYFEKYRNYSIYYLPVNLSESYLNICLVRFKDNKIPDDFPLKYGFDTSDSGDKIQYWIKISGSEFLLVEYNKPTLTDEMSLIKSILVYVESLRVK